MTHLSHAYPQGGNLYFIFVAKMRDINEYLDLQYSVLDAILKAGAAMSHHHGIGKQTAPWLEDQIGKAEMDVIRVLRNHFDPHHVMKSGWNIRPGYDGAAKKETLGMQELDNRRDGDGREFTFYRCWNAERAGVDFRPSRHVNCQATRGL